MTRPGCRNVSVNILSCWSSIGASLFLFSIKMPDPDPQKEELNLPLIKIKAGSAIVVNWVQYGTVQFLFTVCVTGGPFSLRFLWMEDLDLDVLVLLSSVADP